MKPQDLQNQFNQVVKTQRFAALNDEQWAILLEGAGNRAMQSLHDLITASKTDPEAMESLKVWHKVARLTDALRAMGFPHLTRNQMRAIFDNEGQDRVTNTVVAIQKGEESATRQFTAWINRVALAVGESSTPAQSTPSSANQARTQACGTQAPSRFGAVPPPPGVRTGPTRRAETPGASEARNVDRPQPGHASERAAPAGQQARSAPQGTSSDRQPQRHERGGEVRPLRANQPAEERTREAAKLAERQFDQHQCYGSDTAVSFKCSPNMDRTAKTVNIEAAKAKQGSCKGGVDWDNAIKIMLEPHEVQVVAAVLLGFGSKARFAGHGKDNMKWFEITETEGEWEGAVRIQVGQGKGNGNSRAVNIGPTDIGEVSALFLRALESQLRCDPILYPMILRRAYDLYQKNAARTQRRRA